MSVGSASRRACLDVSLSAPPDPLRAGVTRDPRRGGFFSAIALFSRPAAVIRLRDSDPAGLDVLGFGQSQRHETLIDLRTDFVGSD